MGKKNEKKGLNEVIKELEREYGKGSVIHGNEKEEFVDVVSTGSLGLDTAIGVGGIPKRAGKIIEMYGWESSGKSTIAQTIAGNFQKAGEKVLLVDGENSLDEKYSTALGMNLEDLLLIQLDESAGEGAYNKMERIVETGEIGLVIIDSYNSLQPLKLVEGEIGDSTLGLHARMLNQAVMKANYLATKYGTNFLFLGQLREKIGVMFGCLHADVLVNFVDGRSIPIRKVVDEKIQGEVWSWNEKENKFEPKSIIDWHFNGNVVNNHDYLHFQTESIDSNNGRFGFTVTPNHKILTEYGWKEAKDVNIGDKILSKYQRVINGEREQFLLGMLAGDSHLSLRSKNTACLRLQDSKNEEYVKWKIKLMGIPFKQVRKRFDSEYTYQFSKYKKEIGNRNPLLIFKDGIIPDLSLAVWIMDDGSYQQHHKRYTLSIKRFKNNETVLNDIKELFIKQGLECNYNLKSGLIVFTVNSSKTLAQKIKNYIPSCMSYKLPKGVEFYGDELSLSLSDTDDINVPEYVQVIYKRISSSRQMRQKGKYDISIEDNHNYLVGGIKNGIIVHNSPETTQGGNALRFYSHVRLKVSRSTTEANSLKEGDTKIGNKTTVRVEKNKLGSPFKSCSFNIIYGKGIDVINELIDIADNEEIIRVYGKSITYNDVKYDGEEFRTMLETDSSLFKEIKQKILEK